MAMAITATPHNTNFNQRNITIAAYFRINPRPDTAMADSNPTRPINGRGVAVFGSGTASGSATGAGSGSAAGVTASVAGSTSSVGSGMASSTTGSGVGFSRNTG